ncbi:transcriptional repressor [candidate division KSB1 bacterium]|nr:transcriptional repressor [candidate division KSB1 bacterium]
MASQSKVRYDSYIQENQLKSSKRRDLIFEHILQIQGHFTVDNIYQEICKIDPGIGIATIYRTVKLLVASGVLTEQTFGEKKGWFEIADQKFEHHDHMICTSCGKIIEFHNKVIESNTYQIARTHRFIIYSHKLEIFGLCNTCQKQ